MYMKTVISCLALYLVYGKPVDDADDPELDLPDLPLPTINSSVSNFTLPPPPSLLPPEEPAGFRVRVTENAFDYFTTLGVDFLMSQVPLLKIPDVKQVVAGNDVIIRNIKIEKFERPEATISTTYGHGVSCIVSSLNLHVTADYEAEMIWWTSYGNVDIQTEDLIFTVELNVGKDIYGRPTSMETNCYSDGNLIVEFEGDSQGLLNVGSALAANTMTSVAINQVCYMLQEMLDENFDLRQGVLPRNSSFQHLHEFNFGLTKYPDFLDEYIETSHKGVQYHMGERVEPPFHQAEIPDFEDHSERMFYIYLSDFMLNSGFHAFYQGGFLSYHIKRDLIDQYLKQIPKDMAPVDLKDILSASCEFPQLCLGTIFPGLPLKYPDAEVEITVYASKSPEIHFYNGNSLNFSLNANIDFHVKKDDELLPAFSLSFCLLIDLTVNIIDGNFFFTVKQLKPTVGILSSNVGDIGTGFLYETGIRLATYFVLPQLEKLGKKGIQISKDIPIEGDGVPENITVRVSNPEIMHLDIDGVFIMASDVNINIPKDLNVVDMLLSHLANSSKNSNVTATMTPAIEVSTLMDSVSTTSTTTTALPVRQKRKRGNRKNKKTRDQSGTERDVAATSGEDTHRNNREKKRRRNQRPENM